MKKIKLIRSNHKTSIPKRSIRKAINKPNPDILSPGDKKNKDPAKRTKAMLKHVSKRSKLTSEQKSIAFKIFPFERRMMKRMQELRKKWIVEEKSRLMRKEASRKKKAATAKRKRTRKAASKK